jgi:predicted O-methyltransferase YrrM
MEQVVVAPFPVLKAYGNPYLSAAETGIVVSLIASVNPRVVVEFGVNRGKTALAILSSVSSIEKYIGIDVPFGHETRLRCQQSEVLSESGLHASSDRRFSLLSVPGGSIMLHSDDLEPIDAAFIDGDHSRNAVIADSILARNLMRPGGIIVWHDYDNSAVEVTEVLDRLVGIGWPILRVTGTMLAFMRMP